MTEQDRRGPWFRVHANGMIASVSGFPGDADRFVYGAHQAGVVEPEADTRGFEHAKAKADALANCPHCGCPAWTE
jgi:hypothetical protein